MKNNIFDLSGQVALVAGGSGDPALMTDEQWYYVVDTDLTGLFRLCREVARLSMIPNNYGRIVNVSSMHGFVSRKHVWSGPRPTARPRAAST